MRLEPKTATMVRQPFLRAQYNARRIYRRLGLNEPTGFENAANGDGRSAWRVQWYESIAAHRRRALGDSLDVMIRLFEAAEPARASDVSVALDSADVRLFLELGVLALEGGWLRPLVQVSDVQGLLIFTDTDASANDGSSGAAEAAMPVYLETFVFAQKVPRERVGRGLDLCTGSGVHALLMARHCDHVFGSDISERAITLARFNAAVNDMENVRFGVGAGWSAVPKGHFDLVVSNPPYQPEPGGSGPNWWGGGDRGDSVWLGLLAGLEQRLAARGQAHFILQALSWSGDAFTDRVHRHAPTLTAAFDPCGDLDLEEFRSRYPVQATTDLEHAEYGVLRLGRRARQPC